MNSKPAQYCLNRPRKNLEWIHSRLSHYVPKLTDPNWDFVLDFGCGTGDVTKNILLPHCLNVTKLFAVDIQPAFVEFARETFSDERIEYMVLDITQKTPPQWAKMFDKVFAFYSFHYVKDIRKFLEVLWRILTPGGYFLSLGIASSPQFSVWLEMSKKEKWKQYFIGLEKYIPFTHMSNDYFTEIKKVGEKCGFVTLAVTSSLKSVTFDSEKQFLDFYEATLPEEIVKQIPVEDFDRFLKEYGKELKKNQVTKNADGTVTVQISVLEICLQSKSSR